MIFLLILVHLPCPHTGPALRGRCRGQPLCCTERCTMTTLGFIISFFIPSQQGLFYKKITFSTHFFRLLIFSLFLFSIILHWFYIKAVNDCSRSIHRSCFLQDEHAEWPEFSGPARRFSESRGNAASYSARSSMASRTVSAENRNAPLPLYTSTWLPT